MVGNGVNGLVADDDVCARRARVRAGLGPR
jgi:hypothetical protein